ncbi:DUF5819 family protein [Streptomyces sp. NPDC003023]|uniref:DUF5819 family protein n=1 Tax=Streptomyces sp. NPDC003023 TaxID=3364675 RepID=UPI0036BEEC90
MDSYEDEEGKGAGSLSSGVPRPRPAGQPEAGVPGSRREAWPTARTGHLPGDESDAEQVSVPPHIPSPDPAPGSDPAQDPGPDLAQGCDSAPGPSSALAAETAAPVPHEDSGPPESSAAPTGGMAGLSLPYQVAAAVALALTAAVACVHLAMVFLHVAPSNTVTKQHGEVVDGWVYPEFEQNWKLFAPNPLQQNIAVEVRAEYTTTGGGRTTSDWIDLSAEDGAKIRGNLLPSHRDHNQLRRAWDFYVGSHDTGSRSGGLRGRLSESYIRRIAMSRLDHHDLGGPVERIQLRATTTSIEAPPWSDEKIGTRPVHRELPWWTVTAADLPGGVDNAATGTEATR